MFYVVFSICSRTGVTLHDLEGCDYAVEDLHEGLVEVPFHLLIIATYISHLFTASVKVMDWSVW